MLIARDCLCEAQGCFLLYVLCSLITFSSLVPIVFSLGHQQSTFVTVDYRDLSLGLHLLTNSSIFLFLWPSRYQWEGRWRGLRPSVPFLSTLVHFASSPLDSLCPSSKRNLIFRCFDLSSSLLPHLSGLLSTYFSSTHTESSISSLLFPQNDLCRLFAHSAPLITVLLLCCLHQTVQCCAEDE